MREKGEVLGRRAQTPRSLLFTLNAVRSHGGSRPRKRDLASNASGSIGRHEGRDWSSTEERLGEKCNLAEGGGQEVGAAAVTLQDRRLHGSLFGLKNGICKSSYKSGRQTHEVIS